VGRVKGRALGAAADKQGKRTDEGGLKWRRARCHTAGLCQHPCMVVMETTFTSTLSSHTNSVFLPFLIYPFCF